MLPSRSIFGLVNESCSRVSFAGLFSACTAVELIEIRLVDMVTCSSKFVSSVKLMFSNSIFPTPMCSSVIVDMLEGSNVEKLVVLPLNVLAVMTIPSTKIVRVLFVVE